MDPYFIQMSNFILQSAIRFFMSLVLSLKHLTSVIIGMKWVGLLTITECVFPYKFIICTAVSLRKCIFYIRLDFCFIFKI